MIRDLCKWKEVNLIEGEVCPDHVHILVENKVGGMQATCEARHLQSRACRPTEVCQRKMKNHQLSWWVTFCRSHGNRTGECDYVQNSGSITYCLKSTGCLVAASLISGSQGSEPFEIL